MHASQLPLKTPITSSNNNNNNYNNHHQLKSYYYPTSSQRANEVHDLTLIDDDGDRDDDSIIKSEMMELSASKNFYSSHNDEDDDEYSDYATGSPLADAFESEKIVKKPSDNKKLFNTNNDSNKASDVALVHESEVSSSSIPNKTQIQRTQQTHVPKLDVVDTVPSASSSSKIPKLLFSSPSATVTSNGPSVSRHILIFAREIISLYYFHTQYTHFIIHFFLAIL
jgi:hypothetical protein